MAYRAPSTRLAASTPEEQRSGIVFAVMLALALLAIAFPEMAPQALWGILWTGVGLLMIALPPEVRVPRLWIFCAAGFVLSAAAGFLPREWVSVPSWRQEVDVMGVTTGSRAYVQPQLAAEGFASFAVTALAVIYLLGHRVSTAWHHRLAVAFALGVGIWTVAALTLRPPELLFGFFPNRNHTANLLAMGTLAATGALAQAIRLRDPWKIGLSALPLPFVLYALIVRSESRAGIILVTIGTLAWLACTGFHTLRGHTGKAILLLFVAFVGMFSIVDSKVKSRLAATVEKIQTSPEAPAPPLGGAAAEGSMIDQVQTFDARVTIFQNTWKMIQQEPWTGVGPGQFVRVFPQYREKATVSNDSICLHPESDWLLMLAETGWAATLGVLAGVSAVFFTAFYRAWQGRARFLRMGCLVAAFLLCFHGIFDVPGHRIGLAWAAALLVAISLRSQGEQDHTGSRSWRISRGAWRVLGCLVAAAGAWLLHGQWNGTPLLFSARVGSHMTSAKALYDADQAAYQQAAAEGREYQPPAGEDPLEMALAHVDQAIRIASLDPHPHAVRGALALHFDDKQSVVDQSFALQRRLSPVQVAIPLAQAQGWRSQDPARMQELWAEAMRRATAEVVHFPDGNVTPATTYQRILQMTSGDEAQLNIALSLAGHDAALLLLWCHAAPAAMLDREMPALLKESTAGEKRKALFQAWAKRGTKGAPELFARSHPELQLTGD